MTNDHPPPWQWRDKDWRAVVNRVRAGRALKPSRWPGDARAAVALSFDCDHETFELGTGGRAIGRLAWGEFGRRVGVPKILDCLNRHAVPASFLCRRSLLSSTRTNRVEFVKPATKSACTAGFMKTIQSSGTKMSAT